jgi:hypothetical protein
MSLILFNRTLEQQVKSILLRSGGSLYIPSPATCFTDSAGTIPCNVDDPVGYLKDLIGTNNATQATAGFKPILRGKGKNYNIQSNNPAHASWSIKSNVTVSGGTVTINSTAGVSHYVRQGLGSVFSGIPCTLSAIVETTSRYLFLSQNNGGATVSSGIFFDLQTGTVTRATSGYSGYVVNLGNNQYLLVASLTGLATAFFDIGFHGGTNTNTSLANANANGTDSFTLIDSQTEIGTIANTIVTTTTAPKSSSYGPYWADPDATDDALTISNLSAFTSATVIISQKGVGQTTLTGQNISAGYSYNQARSNGLMLIPGTVSDSDLAKLQKYMNRLAGV